MINLTDIFRYKTLNLSKAVAFGFTKPDENGVIRYRRIINDDQYAIDIIIAKDRNVDYRVIDLTDNSPYEPVKIESAHGAFVGEIREKCEALLKEIANSCFDLNLFQAEQAGRITDLIKETLGVSPDFPWDDYPDYAVFRHKDNNKWFAVILTVDIKKIYPDSKDSGNIRILNLKAAPQVVTELIASCGYAPAYHMNKKHWYTAPLDGSFSEDELIMQIKKSFEITLTVKKRRPIGK